MNANPDEAGDIIAKAYNLEPAVAAQRRAQPLDQQHEGGIPYWGQGQIHLDGMKRMIDVQKIVGAITGDVDWTKMIDTRFLPGRPEDAEDRRRRVSGCARVSLRGVTQGLPGARRPGRRCMRSGRSISSCSRGEFFAVVGPSGCGKSTLLECSPGSRRRPRARSSSRAGAIAGEVPDGIGVVFQEDASFPWLTVTTTSPSGCAAPASPRAESVVACAPSRFMGLSDFAHAYPAQLSGGMRQRVCIARTLVLQPRLILLDEPFGALDQQTRLLMGDEVLRLWRETGATVLLITHALDEAAMLADRIGVMSARPGRFIDIVETGWPRERDSRIVAQRRRSARSPRGCGQRCATNR